MIGVLDSFAALEPSKFALIDEDAGRWFTYASLASLSRRSLGGLEAAGLKPGARVAALAHNGAELVALFFACAHGGFTLVPLNWRLSEAELGAVLEDLQPDLLVYDPEFEQLARALAPAARPLASLSAAEESTTPAAPSDDEAIPLILYTSGTTGRPKGAMLSTRMLLANARQTAEGWSLTRDDRTVTAAPFFHTGGWNVLTLPLLLIGGQVTLLRKFEPARVAKLARQGRVTALFGVPTMFQSLLGEGVAGLGVRFVISGGAPCPRPLLDAYLGAGITFLQGFGMTEVGPNCFYFPQHEARRKAGTVGLPMKGTEARVSDDGELYLRGPHVFSGYLNRPEETAAAVSDGWVRTGDLFQRDDEGYYTVLGRRKEMYISGGENVYPAEVETILHAHPAVLEAAVIGVPDAKWGETGFAVVVPRPGQAMRPEDVRLFLQGRLARYKHPRDIRLLNALPRNGMGKVLKSALLTSAD